VFYGLTKSALLRFDGGATIAMEVVMKARPVPIRLAQGALFLFMGSAIVQAGLFLRFSSVWEMHWALPASLALIAFSLLVGIQQGWAFARPLAMAGFGAMAIRGSIVLADRGFPSLAFTFPEVLAIIVVVGAFALATWFGLSAAASRDLART